MSHMAKILQKRTNWNGQNHGLERLKTAFPKMEILGKTGGTTEWGRAAEAEPLGGLAQETIVVPPMGKVATSASHSHGDDTGVSQHGSEVARRQKRYSRAPSERENV